MKNVFISGLIAMLLCSQSLAQNEKGITLDLKDAPIRSTLEMAFKQAGVVNYVIDNSVSGFVTMTITEQPLENVLKLIMRASIIPLTYIKENNVYIVKERQFSPAAPAPAPTVNNRIENNGIVFERIPLTFIDPLDLQLAFGRFLYIRQFQGRMGSGMMGGQGNAGFGMGGGLNNFGNGLGNSMGMGGNGFGQQGFGGMNSGPQRN